MPETDKTATIKKVDTTEENEVYRAYRFDFSNCEFKNCVLLSGAHVSHFSYVGDSILGRDVNLGAGVILSNYRLDGQAIRVRMAGTVVETGLRKFGAMVGDKASIGCNAVINPGSLIARGAKILPGTIWSGVK